MKTKNVYLYVFDTLADWEIGYITAGIHNPMWQANPGEFQLKTFSPDGNPIRTQGGLHVIPDLSIDDVTVADAAMLILPGGASWNMGENGEAAQLALHFHEKGVPVAAICGATAGLARVGVLNQVLHTSNAADYLNATGYSGSGFYREVPALTDQNVITASGTASLAFSREVFQALGLYSEQVLAAWYALFETGSPEAYAALMEAVAQT